MPQQDIGYRAICDLLHTSRPRWKDTSYRNEIFSKTSRNLLQNHVSNEERRNSIRHAIGPYEDLIHTVRPRKLRWYGHITRSTGLAKIIPWGTYKEGERKQAGKEMVRQHIGMDWLNVWEKPLQRL